MLTFLKLVVGVPFIAVCLLLIIGVVIFSIYAVKNRAVERKEYAEYVEKLGKKKKAYSNRKMSLNITKLNADSFVTSALAKAEQQHKSRENYERQKKRYRLNKLKRNRKRNKIAKASRKQNR